MDYKKIDVADIYTAGTLAAHLHRQKDASIKFSYRQDYAGTPIATTLPLGKTSVITRSGSLPPFFAGLLPEGYRLTLLQKTIKTSLDDELSLLLAVGADLPGNIQVLPSGTPPQEQDPAVSNESDWEDFTTIFTTVDPHSIPGIQAKASAQMMTSQVAVRGMPGILKINPKNYPNLVHNEYAHLKAAHKLGLPVAQAEIIRDKKGEPGLLVQRFDRAITNGKLQRKALEDAGQILGIHPAQKYTVDTETLINQLSSLTASPLITKRNLFLQHLFAWLTGNGDLHAKNISLLQNNKGFWEVSPLYDLPCTLIYGDETTALPISGKNKNLKRTHWDNLANSIGLPPAVAQSAYKIALKAASSVDWESTGFEGSKLRGTQRELRFRALTLENI